MPLEERAAPVMAEIARRIEVAGDVATCWRYLTDPAWIQQWFADVEGDLDGPGSRFAFHFGDGDYFSGAVLSRTDFQCLGFQWQFMGVGGVSAVELRIDAIDERTSRVGVFDKGEYSSRAVAELSLGWDDFLARLARTVATGENARYRWSEQIDAGTIVAADLAVVTARVQDVEWWRAQFPSNDPRVESAAEGALVKLTDRAWAGHETTVTVRVTARSRGAGISISHAGWADLPQEIQFDERKRFADLWANALRRFQEQFEMAAACLA